MIFDEKLSLVLAEKIQEIIEAYKDNFTNVIEATGSVKISLSINVTVKTKKKAEVSLGIAFIQSKIKDDFHFEYDEDQQSLFTKEEND